jgi:hypothetical protein
MSGDLDLSFDQAFAFILLPFAFFAIFFDSQHHAVEGTTKVDSRLRQRWRELLGSGLAAALGGRPSDDSPSPLQDGTANASVRRPRQAKVLQGGKG